MIRMFRSSFNQRVRKMLIVKRIPSMTINDIANAVAPNAKHKIIGVRPGEKIHEQMISKEDAMCTYQYSDYFKILPMIHQWSLDPKRIKDGQKVNPDFCYSSDTNTDWMSVDELREWIKCNKNCLDIF